MRSRQAQHSRKNGGTKTDCAHEGLLNVSKAGLLCPLPIKTADVGPLPSEKKNRCAERADNMEAIF
jgi:hypothetical protein